MVLVDELRDLAVEKRRGAKRGLYLLPRRRTPEQARVPDVRQTLQMRNPGLDVLRLVAVVLAMCRHLQPCPESDSRVWHAISNCWQTGGWVGVDLFFVLSGFLVSGLIFDEFERTGAFGAARFLIRRGFKIYPSFYVLIGLTVLVRFATNTVTPFRPLLGELFFLQNYLGGLWAHTWSLAVEEHFYFALAGGSYYLISRRKQTTFRWVPHAFVGLAVACLVLRLLTHALFPEYSNFKHLMGTHIRVDSLFYGVLLAYLHRFEPARLRFAKWSTPFLTFAGVALFIPAFIFPLESHWFMSALWVAPLYVGGGFLLFAFMRLTSVTSPLLRGAAALGTASYSIYLWHLPVKIWGVRLFGLPDGVENWYSHAIWYVLATFAVGYFSSRLIEIPFLGLRNRLFASGAQIPKRPARLLEEPNVRG